MIRGLKQQGGSQQFNFTKEYVTIADGGVEAFIGVKSIDKLIQSLQELKGEINE